MLEKVLEKYFVKRGSIKKISEEIGIPSTTLSSIIRGVSVGKEKTIEKLIAGLNLSELQEKEVWEAWSIDRSKGRNEVESKIKGLKEISVEEMEILNFFTPQEIKEMFLRELAIKEAKALEKGQYNDVYKEIDNLKKLIEKLG